MSSTRPPETRTPPGSPSAATTYAESGHGASSSATILVGAPNRVSIRPTRPGRTRLTGLPVQFRP
ncbi:hypothetical protein AB4Z54_61675, partial [Streptomyces sp. MCAF7]